MLLVLHELCEGWPFPSLLFQPGILACRYYHAHLNLQ
nr:MAG TPA: hypothetical protein [Bacteriophage sp.]